MSTQGNKNSDDAPKPRGCLFYGCLSAGIFACLIVGAIIVGILKAKNAALEFTDTSPTVFDEQSDRQYHQDSVEAKIALFDQAMKEGIDEIELAFNGDELNALIATHKDLAMLRDMVRVSLVGDKLRGKLSLPLAKLNLGFGEGRYLNGEADFRIGRDDDGLTMTLDALTVKGKVIPAQFMSKITKMNLAEKLYEDNNLAAALQRLKGIEVSDGELFILIGR